MNIQEILKLPVEQQVLALEALAAENEALKKAAANEGSRLKVSEKGALSVYGLGRFPVTLYKEQWRRLISWVREIEAFLDANDAILKDKPEKAAKAQ